jgi:hypothetical protein
MQAAQGWQRTRLIHRPCGDIAPPIGGILPSPVVYCSKLDVKQNMMGITKVH